MNDRIAIALFTVPPYPGGNRISIWPEPTFLLSGFVLKDRQHGSCVVLLIYPGSPGPDHKLINIHSVWCINLPENTTITISLKICDGNRFSCDQWFHHVCWPPAIILFLFRCINIYQPDPHRLPWVHDLDGITVQYTKNPSMNICTQYRLWKDK